MTTHLTALYLGQTVPEKTIHARRLYRYYTISAINFLHFMWSISSSLHSCHFWQSSSATSPNFLCLTFHFIIPVCFHQSFSSFLKSCPYHLGLYCCTTVYHLFWNYHFIYMWTYLLQKICLETAKTLADFMTQNTRFVLQESVVESTDAELD